METQNLVDLFLLKAFKIMEIGMKLIVLAFKINTLLTFILKIRL